MRQLGSTSPDPPAPPVHCHRWPKKMGDEGLERTADFPADSHEVPQQCAVGEIPAFVRESGRIAAWDELPEGKTLT